MTGTHDTAIVPNMIIVSRFLEYVKDGIHYITGTETVFCPDCGQIMNPHCAKVRIEARGHEPFYAEPAKIGTRVAKKPKRVGIDRLPAESSRLLDAVTGTADEKERRAVISYTRALEGDENV